MSPKTEEVFATDGAHSESASRGCAHAQNVFCTPPHITCYMKNTYERIRLTFQAMRIIITLIQDFNYANARANGIKERVFRTSFLITALALTSTYAFGQCVVKINNQDYVGSRCYNSTCEAFCALEIHHLQTYTSDPLVPGFEVKPTAQGYIVSSVPPELAAKTGFRPGDKILAIDGILLPLNTDRGSAH